MKGSESKHAVTPSLCPCGGVSKTDPEKVNWMPEEARGGALMIFFSVFYVCFSPQKEHMFTAELLENANHQTEGKMGNPLLIV